MVGLTVVAFGTSAPELAVSTGAVLDGKGGLGVGNAVGSNIFNVLFILGAAALITPLAVRLQVIRQEAPIMIGSALLLIVIGLDGELGLFDGALLLGLLVAYTVYLVRQSRADAGSAGECDDELQPAAPGQRDATLPAQIGLIAGGLALLVAGSEALVHAAVVFARALGLSEVIIGLTIVAAGTSLPEVAASIAASLKGERDIAVGNVVGSCVFNILGVVGLGALAAVLGTGAALAMPPDVARFDLWVMLAALVACLPVFPTGREIARWEGAQFLACYAACTAHLVFAAKRHDGAQALGDALIGFVAPLTIVTLVVAVLRRPAGRAPRPGPARRVRSGPRAFERRHAEVHSFTPGSGRAQPSRPWVAAVQRQEPVASAGFPVAQFQRIVKPVSCCSCRPAIAPSATSYAMNRAPRSSHSREVSGQACQATSGTDPRHAGGANSQRIQRVHPHGPVHGHRCAELLVQLRGNLLERQARCRERT